MKHPKFSHASEVVADLPAPLQSLEKFARNFRWTWHHETRDLFRSIDKALWEASEQNPVQFLTSLPKDRIERLTRDGSFMERLERCGAQLEEYLSSPTWFDQAH